MAAAAGGEKKHSYWWLTNKKMVDRHVREARMLIATQDQSEIAAALRLLEAALTLSPRMEVALELKARSLLHLRRYKDVAEMLQDYIPSLRMAISDGASSSSSSSSSSDSSSTRLYKERATLLSGSATDGNEPAFKCFSVSDLKRKVMSGLFRNVEKEGQWRYSVLGQACCHLGLMEDAMVLLQTGKRLATAASRRQSISLTDDIFPFNKFPLAAETTDPDDSISHLLCHIKLLIRRRTAATAALATGLHSEAIRHFSKILDGRRRAPQGFLSECYVGRASAYRSAGRIAEAIADCNRALALDTSCIGALAIRATLFETIRCLPDSLHDLEHLKLLYNSILRDRRLPGPVWKRLSIQYREIPGKLCSLATKMQQLKQRVAAGETRNVDYHALIGLRRGCSMSELERAHLLLTLKHKPDRSSSFIDKCEFAEDKDVDLVRDRGKMSALLLYRLIQKGHTSVKAAISDEEATEKQRREAGAVGILEYGSGDSSIRMENKPAISATPPAASVFQGVFCRDLAAVGNMLSQGGFNSPINIPVTYEGLSC